MRRWLKNTLNRWLTEIPAVARLLKSAGHAVQEATLIKSAARVESLMSEEIELQYSSLRVRMNEILDLRRAEVACVNPAAYAGIRESHAGPAGTVAQFKERLWDLELALEDRGWQREVALSALEFSRLGVQQLIRIARIYAIKNPLIKRGAEICPLYVFGRGVEIRSEDDTANAKIQDFLSKNNKELGHVGLAGKERSAQTDGALYFSLPVVKGNVKVSMIDPLEIMDVITDPDDTSYPRYFLRQWTRIDNAVTMSPEPMKAWYPCVDYVMDGVEQRLDTIQGTTVNWDMPILRAGTGANPASWRWPIPPVYSSIDWARAYKDFLEDWATVQRTLSRFALMIETKGGQGAIAAYQALMSTTFADANGTQIERNPPPVTGSAHISGPGNTITPFKSAGATTAPEQSRRLGLQAASALGLPETMLFGDASVGSLATAQSLDRPTELKFRERQQWWSDVITQILRYVLFVENSLPGSKVREAAKQAVEVLIVVKFPAVLEHDLTKMVQAIVESFTAGSKMGTGAGLIDRRTIADMALAELGVENRTELLDQIYGKDYDVKKDVADQIEASKSPAPQPMIPGVPPKVKPNGAAAH